MNEPRACRHLYQICPQIKGRFKRQPCYARSSTDVSERGRPRDFRLMALRERLKELADRRLAGAKLTLSAKCRISAVDPKPT
jgi:hypothetical protein